MFYSSDPKDTVFEYAPTAVRSAAFRLGKRPHWKVRADGSFDVVAGSKNYVVSREGEIVQVIETHGGDMLNDPIIQVVWKDEGNFGFITTLRASDLAYREAHPDTVGIPYDPDRVRAYGSLADAQALATEHGAELVVN